MALTAGQVAALQSARTDGPALFIDALFAQLASIDDIEALGWSACPQMEPTLATWRLGDPSDAVVALQNDAHLLNGTSAWAALGYLAALDNRRTLQAAVEATRLDRVELPLAPLCRGLLATGRIAELAAWIDGAGSWRESVADAILEIQMSPAALGDLLGRSYGLRAIMALTLAGQYPDAWTAKLMSAEFSLEAAEVIFRHGALSANPAMILAGARAGGALLGQIESASLSNVARTSYNGQEPTLVAGMSPENQQILSDLARNFGNRPLHEAALAVLSRAEASPRLARRARGPSPA